MSLTEMMQVKDNFQRNWALAQKPMMAIFKATHFFSLLLVMPNLCFFMG